MATSKKVSVRALRTKQGDDVDVYSFFIHGSILAEIADISRIGREEGELKGFQRKEIQNHVKSIVEFLDSGQVLFPNAIILALSPEVEFVQSRGPKPKDMEEASQGGTLSIPIRPEGSRVAWIVDGQQRSLALAKAKNKEIIVPVVGFISSNLETHREQFILVNKARPLPTRLINELLPEVSVLLPRDLAARKVPSELCGILATDKHSPFCGIIQRASDSDNSTAVVNDTAVTKAIQSNLRPPMGALSQYKAGVGDSDIESMYKVLVLYWSAVKDVFEDAWGLPPTKSRLMHSAGIRVMGSLMDPIMLRADSSTDPVREVRESLERIAPHCRWLKGVWDDLGWRWNEVQSTTPHINRLRDHLIKLDRDLSRPGR
jgi:DGQHR domain-containing protein